MKKKEGGVNAFSIERDTDRKVVTVSQEGISTFGHVWTQRMELTREGEKVVYWRFVYPDDETACRVDRELASGLFSEEAIKAAEDALSEVGL